ncbi:RnfH family protein [Paenalcaligenes niemegkensis]|uniref:RnfH family protein n=1 Tax=Paenalcaligenes niemegkensis TaxID=2895469 RepID=UPI001EE87598|nr:RnfH family protein [Paenalcaligenes niemegkensis]MCQ9616302.1 RnfH family protein [Paenalcaligenes niemegkensis]
MSSPSSSASSTITVELLYLSPTQKWHHTLTLAHGATAAQAIAASNIHQQCPETQTLAYGIYGELVNGDRILNNFDRIEYYRDLVFDPMESRRRRAEHRARKLETQPGNKPVSAAARMLANQPRVKG